MSCNRPMGWNPPWMLCQYFVRCCSSKTFSCEEYEIPSTWRNPLGVRKKRVEDITALRSRQQTTTAFHWPRLHVSLQGVESAQWPPRDLHNRSAAKVSCKTCPQIEKENHTCVMFAVADTIFQNAVVMCKRLRFKMSAVHLS